jgi:hypothetical protein
MPGKAINDVQEPFVAQTTTLREDEKTCSSKHVVPSTERPRLPQDSRRRTKSPPRRPISPQLVSKTPVPHLEPPRSTATSPSTCSTTMTKSPALPDPGPPPAAPERRCTRPDPAKHPRNASQTPSSPQNPQQRTVSPPSAHFDWADDAALLPIAPSNLPRDISGLKTGHPQPFGTLQRRTRRRRAPLQVFSSRNFFRSALPSHIASQPFITRRHPAGIGPGRPIVTIPVGVAPVPAASVLKLDWDLDPRLANLSRALRALGWAPP